MSIPARKPRVFEWVCDDLKGIVYECIQDDFECAYFESLHTGVKHISVTGDPAGGYPYLTVPMSQLRELKSTRQEEPAE